jgi:two-component system, cell cycle sensor histidine kinase and response regulator CckA
MDKENSKLHVLIVEDNDADFRLVLEYLKETGSSSFEFLHAQTLVSALKALKEFKFDAVLLDLDLPDSQGLATVEEMCQYSPDTPLIVLTGQSDKEMGIASLKKGAQDYLVKGIARGELLEKSIHYAIERKQAEEKIRKTYQRMVAVLESLSDGFVSWDRNWRLTYVNTAAESMFNQSREKLLGQDVRVVFPGARGVLLARFEKIMDELEPSSFEVYYSQGLTWLEIRMFPSTEGISVLFRDITARKESVKK